MTISGSFRWDDVREAEAAARELLLREQEIRAGQEISVLRQQVSDLSESLAAANNAITGLLNRKALRLAEGANARRRALRARLGPGGRSVGVPTAAAVVTAPPADSGRAPAFSVVIPVFNNGDVLLRALDSVRSQTLPDWEVVIWDDGSSDPQTQEVLAGLSERGIRVFAAANQGVVGARNSAMANAHGEFTVFLDPDDAIEATYLEKALLVFARYPEIDMVIPNTRVATDEGEVIWQPPDLAEWRLSYENLAPIATAFRTRMWGDVGGMNSELDGGFEDWGFWRAAAAKGHRAFMLRDPLFRYTYSHDSGRDAAARAKRDELESRIKRLFPVVSRTPAASPAKAQRAYPAIERQVFHIATAGKRPLVIFLPWTLEGGGAENFLLSAIADLQRDFQVVVVSTSQTPPGFADCRTKFLDLTPYVYDLPTFLGEGDYRDFVASLLLRLLSPTVLIVGSVWAYSNLDLITRELRGKPWVVDLLFNHVGHLGRLLLFQEQFDQVLVAHDRLRSLLVDYYEVSPRVDVLHIAPPVRPAVVAESSGEAPVLPDRTSAGQLRLGWLGRNSPEKRLDLAVQIAIMCPQVQLLIAGGGMVESDRAALPRNAHIVGWVADSRAFLEQCDLLLNTSDTEGISLSAMEALELGVPVLTRDVGGMSELVRHGVNGWVYDCDELSALAEVLGDTELVAQLRANVDRERLPRQFGHEQMVATLQRHLVPRR